MQSDKHRLVSPHTEGLCGLLMEYEATRHRVESDKHRLVSPQCEGMQHARSASMMVTPCVWRRVLALAVFLACELHGGRDVKEQPAMTPRV